MQCFQYKDGTFWLVPLCCKSTGYCIFVSKEDGLAPLAGGLVDKLLAM